MSFPKNMDEAKNVISNAENVKIAKEQLENDISVLISKFEEKTGFVVNRINLNKSYAYCTPTSVKVEVRG